MSDVGARGRQKVPRVSWDLGVWEHRAAWVGRGKIKVQEGIGKAGGGVNISLM